MKTKLNAPKLQTLFFALLASLVFLLTLSATPARSLADELTEESAETSVLPTVESELALPAELEAAEHSAGDAVVAPDEVEAVAASLPGLMCAVAELSVPLMAEVGLGPNWEQAH